MTGGNILEKSVAEIGVPKMKRYLERGSFCSMVLMLALGVASCQPNGGGGGSRFMSIGTGGTAGIYYPLGGAIASQLSLADSTRQYTAEVTGASVENVNRVVRGEIDLGLSLATTVYEAFYGGQDFPEPLENLRLVAPLYPSVIHILTTRNSSVENVSQLRGERVSVGSAGSGTEQVARQVLEAHGLTYDDIRARFLSFRESSDALRDGSVEAAFFVAGYPVSAVLEAMTARAGQLLSIDAEHRGILVDGFPYYTMGAIPSDSYPGVDADVPTLSVMNWIVGADDLDASVVSLLLDLLANRRSELEQVHGIARQIDLNILKQSSPIPFHSETIRWANAELGDGSR